MSWGRNIKAGIAGKINTAGDGGGEGYVVKAGHPGGSKSRQGKRTEVSNASRLSALWGDGRLKTPLRCYFECFRPFFVSQPLGYSMLHVEMAWALPYWEGTAGPHSSAVISFLSAGWYILSAYKGSPVKRYLFIAWKHETAGNRHIDHMYMWELNTIMAVNMQQNIYSCNLNNYLHAVTETFRLGWSELALSQI